MTDLIEKLDLVVVKRNGKKVDFDGTKIALAITLISSTFINKSCTVINEPPSFSYINSKPLFQNILSFIQLKLYIAMNDDFFNCNLEILSHKNSPIIYNLKKSLPLIVYN